MMITCDVQPTVTVLALTGELNALSSPGLKTTLSEALSSGATNQVVDLSAVTFIDSSGLGALVSGLKHAKLANGNMVLVGLHAQARVIFEITMAYRIFDIFETPAEGLAFLAR